LKIKLCKDNVLSDHIKATQNFLPDNTFDSHEWTSCLPDLTSLDYLVWDILQELVYEGKREPFVILKDLQNVVRGKWHDVDIRQSESVKPHCSKKGHFYSLFCFATAAKQNKEAIHHIFCLSVD